MPVIFVPHIVTIKWYVWYFVFILMLFRFFFCTFCSLKWQIVIVFGSCQKVTCCSVLTVSCCVIVYAAFDIL